MNNFFLNLKIDSNYLLLLGLLFFPILPFNFSSIIIIVFSLSSIFINWSKGLSRFKLFSVRILIVNCLYVFFIIISLIYTTNIEEGFTRIKVLLPIIILPIIIVFFQKKYKERQYFLIFKVFIFANFLFLLFTAIYFLRYSVEYCYYEISELPYVNRIFYIWNVAFKDLLWCAEQRNDSFFLIHKTYNAINLLIASLFAIQLYFKSNSSIFFKSLLLLLLFLFSSVIVYFKSLIGIFFVITIIPFNFLRLKYNAKKALMCIGILLVALLFVLFLKKDSIIDNINKETEYSTVVAKQSEINGVFERIYLNLSSIQLFLNEPIMGYGIGDVKDNLSKQNLINSNNNNNYINFYENKLNTHNYYFNLILTGGPIIFISFLYMIWYNSRLAIDYKNYIYISFLIIITITLCFENLFDRMMGVLTFSIMNSLFIKYIFDNKVNKI